MDFVKELEEKIFKGKALEISGGSILSFLDSASSYDFYFSAINFFSDCRNRYSGNLS